METRKLQKVGGGTYTVSIPKAWATERELEAGTEVDLHTHVDGSIVVRSAETDSGDLDAATLAVEGTDPDHVRRALWAAHGAGFDEVCLVPPGSFTGEQREAARAVARTLVGTVVDTARDDEIRVRSVLDVADVSIHQSVVQLGFTARSVHEAATAAFVEADADAGARLRERLDEVARQRELVSRHVGRALTSFAALDCLDAGRAELFDDDAVARHLAAMAESGVALARVGQRLDAPLPDAVAGEFRRAAEECGAVVGDATAAAVGTPDTAAAHDALDRCDEAVAAVDALHDVLAREDSPCGSVDGTLAAGRALGHLVQTAERGGAVAEVALRAAARTDGG